MIVFHFHPSPTGKKVAIVLVRNRNFHLTICLAVTEKGKQEDGIIFLLRIK